MTRHKIWVGFHNTHPFALKLVYQSRGASLDLISPSKFIALGKGQSAMLLLSQRWSTRVRAAVTYFFLEN